MEVKKTDQVEKNIVVSASVLLIIGIILNNSLPDDFESNVPLYLGLYPVRVWIFFVASAGSCLLFLTLLLFWVVQFFKEFFSRTRKKSSG